MTQKKPPAFGATMSSSAQSIFDAAPSAAAELGKLECWLEFVFQGSQVSPQVK